MSFPAVRWRPGRSLRPTLATYRWRNMIYLLTSSEAPEWAYSAFHMIFVSAIQPSLFMFFNTINVPGISSCMFNKEECPLYLYVDCTSSSSPVDRSFVDQTELSFHGRRFSKTSSKFIFGCSTRLFVFAELYDCSASPSATMLRVSCPCVITRHNYDDSNRSCFITLSLRVRYIMTTDL